MQYNNNCSYESNMQYNNNMKEPDVVPSYKRLMAKAEERTQQILEGDKN